MIQSLGFKLKAEELISRFINIHGNKYSYSKFIYINFHTSGIITCLKDNHGDFLQIPTNHLNGNQGCKQCRMEESQYLREQSKIKYIEIANIIHDYIYDYSLFEFKNCNIPGIIICNKLDKDGNPHGNFLQSFSSHVNKGSKGKVQGCPKCGIIKCHNSLKNTYEEFVNKSNITHNYIYDYSKFEYITTHTKGIIICSKLDGNGILHGEFSQTPNCHIDSKQGCPKCGNVRGHDLQRLTLDEFLGSAIKLNGNKYDYHLITELKGNKVKVPIICNKNNHGIFYQAPDSHIGHQQQGCPKCRESKGEKKVRIILDHINIIFTSQHSFDDCVNTKSKRKLKFDFYLSDYNTIIEFDGSHHYSPSYLDNIGIRYRKYHTEENYNKNKFNDDIKNKYCKDNNIHLLRIPFFNEDTNKAITKEEIEILIKEFINSLESDKL